jgi:hypothetical protein
MGSNMRITYTISIIIALALFSACGGGGGKSPIVKPIDTPTSSTIQSLNFSPANVTTGTVVEVSATYTNASAFESAAKLWLVGGGTISEQPPDFDLVLRETAGIKATSATLTTTASKVYWLTPTRPGSYNVSLRIGNAYLVQTVEVTTAPIGLEVLPGEGNSVVVRVVAQDVTNLYQAAFRVVFNASIYAPTEVTPGTLLGGSDDILFIGLTNQNGFVPIAITRKGSAGGVSGSGVLAEIVFTPKAASRVAASISISGFELLRYVLRDSSGQQFYGD